VTTIVVTFIAYRLLKEWWPAVIAGALFALHPAHTETVSWIGGRADLVCGLFYFPAVLFFIMYLQRRGSPQGRAGVLYALALLMAMGALLGKEIGVTVPVALVLTDLFLYPAARSRFRDVGYWRGRIAPHLPFFGVVAIYGLMRFYLVAAHIVTNTYSGPSLLNPV